MTRENCPKCHLDTDKKQLVRWDGTEDFYCFSCHKGGSGKAGWDGFLLDESIVDDRLINGDRAILVKKMANEARKTGSINAGDIDKLKQLMG